MLEEFGRVILVFLGLAVLFVLICVPHNVRVWRVRKDCRSLPDDIIETVLKLIENAAKLGPSVTFLQLSEEVPNGRDRDVLLESHAGGRPYAEAGDEWPPGTPDGKPAEFMVQVRLDEPSLGIQWQNRLLVVFMVFDVEQVVWSYRQPSVDRYSPVESNDIRNTCIRLRHLRMPAESADEKVPMSPYELCKSVPEIEELLRHYTKDVVGVVSQILRPNMYGYDLDTSVIAYVGGDPIFNQYPEDRDEPPCKLCGKRMRFLFLFGEMVPGVHMTNGGVCCIYGCDDHPDQCRGFIDFY